MSIVECAAMEKALLASSGHGFVCRLWGWKNRHTPFPGWMS